jgi:signal recognition particle subunit SRP54
VLSLIEDVQKGIDQDEAAKMAKKLKSGKGFDLEDFKTQIQQMQKMGGMASLMEKMPGQIGQMAKGIQGAEADKAVRRLEGIINSMTLQERHKPELIKASRKRRIAAGAGVTVQEVNRLLNQFEQTQKMMKQFSSKGGLMKLMRGMKGMMPGM